MASEKRVTACLIILSLALIAAGPPQKGGESNPKAAPDSAPDESAYVPVLQEYWPGTAVQLDAESNVTTLCAQCDKLVKHPDLCAAVAKLRHVRHLYSEGKSGDDLLLAAMAKWPDTLDDASLGADASDEALSNLEHFQSLEDLGLKSDRLTDAAFQHIGKLKALRRLGINAVDPKRPLKITGSGFKDLADVQCLRELFICGCLIEDSGAKNLSALPLKELSLYFTTIGDDGIKAIGEIRSLESLGIIGGAASDNAFFHLRRLENLATFGIERCPHVTGRGLTYVASLKKLTGLTLRDCPVSDSAVAEITGMHLILLNLSSTEISDHAVDDIKKIPGLEVLFIENTKISQAGLRRLKAIKGLQINEAGKDRQP